MDILILIMSGEMKMYIKYQQNEKIGEKIHTIWYVFETKNKNYTKKLAEKIKNYLVEYVNSNLENATLEQIMGWFTGKYERFYFDEKFNCYELETSNSFASKKQEHVNIVNIDLY